MATTQRTPTSTWPIGGGEMGARIRAHDWAATPLGPVDAWPQSLRTAVQLVLAAPFAHSVLWGPDLVQIYNDAYAALMGAKHPAGLGQPTRVCWPEVWHIDQSIYARVRQGESVAVEDALYPITRSGVLEDAWLTIAYSPIRDEAGAVAGVLVTAFETTARLRAEAAQRRQQEAALRASEELRRLAIESGRMGAWRWDARARLCWGDAEFLRLWGMPPSDERFPVSVFTSRMAPESAAAVEAVMAKDIAPGEEFDGLLEIAGGPNAGRWIRWRGRAERERPWIINGVSFDVTEQRLAEARLRESEAKYRTLFDSIDQGVAFIEILFDAAGQPVDFRWLQVNRAFEQETGLPNVVGKTVREVFPTFERSPIERYAEVALTGQPVRVERFVEQLDQWFSVYAAPVVGKASGQVALVFANITARKRAEQALRASEARQGYLLRLADALRRPADPVAVQEAAARVLGEHLGASRVNYAEIHGDEAIIEREYTSEVPSLVGKHRLSTHGDDVRERFERGVPDVVEDTQGDPRLTPAQRATYAAMASGAHIAVQLIKEGRPVAAMVVQDRRPRRWTPDEVALVQETAERTWAAVERARAEAALREADARFRAMADAAPVLIWETDASGVIFLNRQYLDFFGEDFETVRDMGWARFMHPEDAASYEAAWREAFQRRQPYTYDCRFRRADGQYRWLRNTGQPMGDTRMVGCSLDITESKRAEAALRESEERLRRALSIQTVGVLFFGLDGSILDANATFERMTGYRVQELRSGVHWATLTPPEFMDATARAAAELAERGETAPYEKQFIRKDGSRFWGLFAPTRLAGTGPQSECVEFIIDITRAKQNQEALRAAHDRIATILESTSECFYALDAEFRFIYVNRQTEAYFGIPKERMLGRRYMDVLPKTRGHEILTGQQQALAERRTVRFETVSPTTGRLVALNAFPAEDGGLAVYFQDVTERRAAEAALAAERERLAVAEAVAAERQALLKRIVRAQEEERAKVSREIHDSVTQLAHSAALHLDVAVDLLDGTPPRARQAVERGRDLARSAAAEARRLIAGLRPELLDTLGLAGAIGQEIEALRAAGWAVEFQDGDLSAVRPDPEAEITLFRVAQEALSNVRKHAGRARVRVRLKRANGSVRLEVRDWGRGFDPRSVRSAHGEHVGLVGMRERVHLLGGRLEIRSGPDHGTTIRITLPVGGATRP